MTWLQGSQVGLTHRTCPQAHAELQAAAAHSTARNGWSLPSPQAFSTCLSLPEGPWGSPRAPRPGDSLINGSWIHPSAFSPRTCSPGTDVSPPGPVSSPAGASDFNNHKMTAEKNPCFSPLPHPLTAPVFTSRLSSVSMPSDSNSTPFS